MMRTVPYALRDKHPFGPDANAARERGVLRDYCVTKEMAAWAEFGRKYLCDGDILFRFGRSHEPFDRLSNCLIAGISDSPFSHVAIIHREGCNLWVYDAENEGVRKIPFDRWMLDTDERRFAVKRLRPEFQYAIPAAMAWIEDAYWRNVPFDFDLRLDDEKLYCSELVEKGFRSTGLILDEPIPLRTLPCYARYAVLRPFTAWLTRISVDEPIFAIGNSSYGLYASPLLETVFEGAKVQIH